MRAEQGVEWHSGDGARGNEKEVEEQDLKVSITEGGKEGKRARSLRHAVIWKRSVWNAKGRSCNKRGNGRSGLEDKNEAVGSKGEGDK